MDASSLIDSLERTAEILPALIEGLKEADLRWRPPGDDGAEGTGGWSILEIVCHMADEEVEDFRMRLALTLRDPQEEWPGIDPEGAAAQRAYNESAMGDVLERFVSERKASVEGLRGLLPPESAEAPDWAVAHQHPKIGALRAGDLLASWAAHDALHIRQISKRLFQLVQRNAQPYSTTYAGPWPEAR